MVIIAVGGKIGNPVSLASATFGTRADYQLSTHDAAMQAFMLHPVE
jgi:hypothetical protein